MMKGLAPHTGKIIDGVSKLECIKPFLLVGGTALSIQIGTRESEDLDFMRWRRDRNDKLEVEWNKIEKELATVGTIESVNLMGFDHVEFIVSGVKLSFYASDKYSPVASPVHFLNNIYLADVESIGAMKMEVMLRRSNFRDYYDIYSILKEGIPLEPLIDLALKYSGNRLKKKHLLSMLTSGSRFHRDSRFEHLNPKYSVTAQEIEAFIIDQLVRFSPH